MLWHDAGAELREFHRMRCAVARAIPLPLSLCVCVCVCSAGHDADAGPNKQNSLDRSDAWMCARCRVTHTSANANANWQRASKQTNVGCHRRALSQCQLISDAHATTTTTTLLADSLPVRANEHARTHLILTGRTLGHTGGVLWLGNLVIIIGCACAARLCRVAASIVLLPLLLLLLADGSAPLTFVGENRDHNFACHIVATTTLLRQQQRR